MRYGIGLSSQLIRDDLPTGAVEGWVNYPSRVIPGGTTRAAVWIVDFPTQKALCEWVEEYYAVAFCAAWFDDMTSTWLLTVCQEPEYSD